MVAGILHGVVSLKFHLDYPGGQKIQYDHLFFLNDSMVSADLSDFGFMTPMFPSQAPRVQILFATLRFSFVEFVIVSAFRVS